MGRTHQFHSIVLHTHDVGEADRFCIVLTKERGRIAARARGVRKPKSRIGGSILPLQEARLTVRESAGGWYITDCALINPDARALPFQSFLHATQCADILLSLLEDDTPVPEVFTLLQEFVSACRLGQSTSPLPFVIQLLCTLGLLPFQLEHAVFTHLEAVEKDALQHMLSVQWAQASCAQSDTRQIAMLCTKIIEDQSRRPLKAGNIAMMM